MTKTSSSLSVVNEECLANIVEYCFSANEVECLKSSCKRLYNLFRSCDGEELRVERLKDKLSSMYLPRLFLQISLPVELEENSTVDGNETNDINDATISSEIDYYLRDMRRIYGNASIKQVSSNEVEVLVDLDDENKLTQFDAITSRSDNGMLFKKAEDVPIPVISPNSTDHHSLCETVRQWRSEHPLENDGISVNPVKVIGKFILHLQFIRNTGKEITAWDNNHHRHFTSNNHIDIIASNDASLNGFGITNYISTQGEIFGSDRSVLYNFDNIRKWNMLEYQKKGYLCRIAIYYYLRHMMIPSCQESLIDLTRVYDSSLITLLKKLQDVTKIKEILLIRRNVIKSYRDAILNKKADIILLEDRLFFSVLRSVGLISIETMKDKSRDTFMEIFLKGCLHWTFELDEERRKKVPEIQLGKFEACGKSEAKETTLNYSLTMVNGSAICNAKFTFPCYPFFSAHDVNENYSTIEYQFNSDTIYNENSRHNGCCPSFLQGCMFFSFGFLLVCLSKFLPKNRVNANNQ